jgi:uncharacterized protein (TIGR03435 family)
MAAFSVGGWSGRTLLAVLLWGVWCGCVGARGQAPAFEVASVKTTASDSARSRLARPAARTDAGRVELEGVSLAWLVASAYRVAPDHVSGPSWLTEERFDIAAKLPEGASKDSIPEMMRSLLAERFKLVAHAEQKVVPIYALTVGPKGIAFKKSDSPGPVRCTSGPCAGFSCRKISMKSLAERMSQATWQRRSGLDRPVVDLTGLEGIYDLDLNVAWIASSLPAIEFPPDCGLGNSPVEALRAVGLSLERQKQTQDFLVVDSALKTPIPN